MTSFLNYYRIGASKKSLQFFFDKFSFFIRQDNNFEKTKKVENKIMLPVSGNILLYDMSISLHSERLRIIYDSSRIETETSGANLESSVLVNNGSSSNSNSNLNSLKTTM